MATDANLESSTIGESNPDLSKSNPCNPYSTHHSDHPGLVLISKPLTGDNYSVWNRAMTLALNSKNKLGFVNGNITAPSKILHSEEYATWSRCNDMVHSWIMNTLSPEISDSVIYHATAHEVWEDLRERFSQSNAPRIFEIHRNIVNHRQEQLTISAYYTRLKSMWDELASYNETPYEMQQDRQKLLQFLMGLNETYSAVRGQILLMNPLPSVRQAYSSISQEEKQRNLSATLDESNNTAAAAMAVRVNNNKTGGGGHGRSDRPHGSRDFGSYEKSSESFNGGRHGNQGKNRSSGGGRGRPSCSHCGKPGHWVESCYELCGYPENPPKSGPNHRNQNHQGPNMDYKKHVANACEFRTKDDKQMVTGLSEAQLKQLLSLLNDKNEGSSSQANVVTKPGSGYEEDDWFG